MKKLFYLLPVILLSLVSFRPLNSDQTDSKNLIILTGCFEDEAQQVYIEVDYSTGTSSITQIRIYDIYRLNEYTYAGHNGTASYSGGHVHVSLGFTVYYSNPVGTAYPPSTTLSNDCWIN